jgi:hypothetical protein
MLILDKQRAVERVVALTAGVMEAPADAPAVHTHARTYQRIATYERRAHVTPAPLRRGVERRRRRMRLLAGPSPA